AASGSKRLRRAKHTESAICVIVSKPITHDVRDRQLGVSSDRIPVRHQHSRVGARLDGESTRRSHGQHVGAHNPKSHQTHRSNWYDFAARHCLVCAYAGAGLGEAHSGESSQFQESSFGRCPHFRGRSGEQFPDGVGRIGPIAADLTHIAHWKGDRSRDNLRNRAPEWRFAPGATEHAALSFYGIFYLLSPMTASRSNHRKRVLSGMRCTGKLHLGNYVGALDNWVRMQDEYECFFFVADLHALTTDYADTSRIKENS